MSNYWIKLYIEVLDDPKMATLPDHLWRRAVESLLRNKKNWHCDPYPHRLEWIRIRKKLTPVILERDGWKCKYCGMVEYLEIDHVIPLARGGSSDPGNLQVLCRSCNRRKWAN